MSAVKRGDAVWDVGANVGVYSELFCRWVGDEGFVVAFEPLPDACEQIRRRMSGCSWLKIENVALSDIQTVGQLVLEADSVENHVATEADVAGSSNTIPVVICRGDEVCRNLGRMPNTMKIDVEGFEEEVLAGMGEMLASPTLRNILVEVHFLKLELRGRATAPVRIEKMLAETGFRTTWVDSSHLFATKQR